MRNLEINVLSPIETWFLKCVVLPAPLVPYCMNIQSRTNQQLLILNFKI